IRQLHVAAINPELRVVALVGVIMQHEEITDAFELPGHGAIVWLDLDRGDVAIGEERHEVGEAALDQVDAGRLERLEESGRQPERETVLVPKLLAASCDEFDDARLGAWGAIQIREQGRNRLIVADVLARIDIAVADAMLQRNAPLPAGFARGGTRVRRELTAALTRYRHGAVAWQPMAPIFVTRLECLLDQQAAKAGAVDEEIAFDTLAAFEHDRRDEPVLAPLLHVHNLPFGTNHAPLLGVTPQEARIQCRVEVKRISNIGKWGIPGVDRAHELPASARNGLQGEVAQVRGGLEQPVLQPVGVKRYAFHAQTERPERMNIAMADTGPIDELNAELESRSSASNKVVLVQRKHPIERPHLRDGRLADADRANLLRFDEANFAVAVLEKSSQRSSGHPTCSAAAHDDDPSQPVRAHVVSRYVTALQ